MADVEKKEEPVATEQHENDTGAGDDGDDEVHKQFPCP